MKILVTVKDGYSGKTADLFAIVPGDKEGKIYFTNYKDVYYWSGAVEEKAFTGTNQIVLPLRHFVEGLKLITAEETTECA